MSYQSPIELIQTQMEERITDTIFEAVMSVGVNVDKEELLKALAYDRCQYQKGYADRAQEIVRCKDCKYWIRQTAEKGGESVLGINYTTCVCKKFRDWDTWNEYDSNFGRTDEDWFCADGERR